MKVKFKNLSNEQKESIMQSFKVTGEWKRQATQNINKRVKKKQKLNGLCYKDYLIHARCQFDENETLYLLSTFHFLTVADVEKLFHWIYGNDIPKYLEEYKIHRVCIFFNPKVLGEHKVYVFSLYGMETDDKLKQLREDIKIWAKQQNSNCLGHDLIVSDFINDTKEMARYLEKTHRFNEQGEFIQK